MSTTEASAEFLALQSVVAGRYSLEREIGRGGMGVVFLARDVALDRPVAVKLLPPTLAAHPELRQRFLQEARTAAGLSHPNIVPIHAVEEHGDLVFFVMMHVDGETLGQRVRRAGALKPSGTVRLIQEVAWALGYAHANDIVHRDVKPDNILLDKATERALVTDFGIAKVADAQKATGTGELVGTAHYMSPEQASGSAVDARSDLYSLGVTAFFALTGRVPFEAPNAVAVAVKHINEPAPPVASLRTDVPQKLAVVVDRCLEKAPAARFQSGEELAEAAAEMGLRVKEIPPHMRHLLRTAGAAGKALVFVGVIVGVIGLAGIYALLAGKFIPSGVSQLALLLVQVVAIVSLLMCWSVLRAARIAVRSGATSDDLRAAVAVDVRTRLEEWQVAAGGQFDKRRIDWTGAIILALGIWALFDGDLVVAAGLGVPAVLLLYRELSSRSTKRKRREKVLAARRRVIIGGSVGRWLLRIAGIGLKAKPQVSSPVDEPTEILLGSAVDALFAALPRVQQRQVADVPSVIRRLQAHAQALRKRRDELDRAMTQATIGQRGLGAQVAEHRADAVTELEGAARLVAERLASVVAALENLRLDLMRLSAGQGSIDDLTVDLEAARGIGEAIDRLLKGQREVAGMLKAEKTIPSQRS